MRLDVKFSLMTFLSSLFLVVVLLGITVVGTNRNNAKTIDQSNKTLLKSKRAFIHEMTAVAVQIAQEADTEEQAIKELSKIRYEKGSGYFFAYKKEGSGYSFAFHGTKPALNSKATNINAPDVKGFVYRKALIDAADSDSDGGFAEYHYQNPKSKVISKKIAFAKKVTKWDWYLVTGVYMDDIGKELDAIEKTNVENRDAMISRIIFISLIVLVVAVVISVLFVRKVAGKLLQQSVEVSELAMSTTKVANVIADAGHTFSAATTEQSASLEETSASLEELDKMIKENMESSHNTGEAVEYVKRVTDESNSAMSETMQAIDEVIQSNKEIEELSRVIQEIGEKTSIIDEIVFQTKLLSFNASVEAERAGEHGRGFAVVAQEVGNLAQMSGKAAQEIAEIVKGSVEKSEKIVVDNRIKVERGNELVKNTALKLKEIEHQAHSVADQMHNIVSASKEQSLGISQITAAVQSIDSAVQTNVSSAEEVAAVGRELVSYSNKLNHIASELKAAITGAK